jgi:hypothetical protein
MPRMADCHPDRRHVGRGFCASCYQDDYNRRHGRRLARRTNLTGLLHLGETLDPLLPALRWVPAACPWCHNACLRHYEGAPEVNCPLCGWEALLEPPRTAQGLAWR